MYTVVSGAIETTIAPLLDRIFVAVRMYLDRIPCTEWHMLLDKKTLGNPHRSLLPSISWYKFTDGNEIIAIIDTLLMSL